VSEEMKETDVHEHHNRRRPCLKMGGSPCLYLEDNRTGSVRWGPAVSLFKCSPSGGCSVKVCDLQRLQIQV